MNGTAKTDLIKGVLAGERVPLNREERRAWEQYDRAYQRRGRRARARVQRGLARHELRQRALGLFAAARGVVA